MKLVFIRDGIVSIADYNLILMGVVVCKITLMLKPIKLIFLHGTLSQLFALNPYLGASFTHVD